MITKLYLKNFRQHRELTLDLQPGFTALRGQNEAGKSTALEAIMFALFGIRACRNNDITTWGEQEKSVKVELWLMLNGEELHISRSKLAAEINYVGQTVTGQTECTKFIESQLQLQPGLGPKLMIAGQQDIQGVLTQKGGQAATEMIEGLADLEVIDRIISGLQAKYPTGNTKLIENRVETAGNMIIGRKDKISQLILDAVLLPTDEDIGREETAVDELRQQYVNLGEELAVAKQERDEANATNDTRAKVIRRLHAAEDNLKGLEASRTKLGDDAPPAPEGELDTEVLEAGIRQFKAKQKHFVLYTEFMEEKATAVEALYAGSRAELKAEISELVEKLEAAKADVATIPQRIETLLAKKVSASVCGFCAKDVSQFPEVAEKNAELDKQISVQRAELAHRKGEVATLSDQLIDLRTKLNKVSLIGWYDRNPNNFTVDATVCPEIVSWNGEPPTDLKGEILEMENQLAAVNRWKVADAQYSKQQGNLDRQIAEAKHLLYAEQEAVAALPPCLDTVKLSAAVDKLHDDQLATAKALETAKERVAAMKDQVKEHTQKLAEARQSLLDAELQLSEAKEELEEITFNNNLIKKLRTVRPEIANKIWSSVLGAVSHYFSTMRGTKSVVSKLEDVFLVDGSPVTSYSGSTQDVLGLALRIALIRTFLPTCDFMLLDEPFAACDDGRQTTALGFLAGAGFKQLLVITHEDISESVADNLVTL